MPAVLLDLELDEVSVVDKGANPGAKIALFKRKDPAMSFAETLSKFFGFTKSPGTPGSMPPVTLDQVLAKLPPEDKALLLEALEAAGVQAGVAPVPAPGEAPAQNEPGSDPKETPPAEPPAVPKGEQPPQNPPAPGKPPEPGANPAVQPPKKEEKPMSQKSETPADIAKAAEERDAAIKKAADLEVENKALKMEKRKGEFVAKAETLKSVPGASADELALLLMKCADKLESADFAKLEAILKSANELIVKSGVFKEEGSSATGANVPGDAKEAHEKLNAMASELLKMGKASTFAKGYTMACEQNPKLFDQATGR